RSRCPCSSSGSTPSLGANRRAARAIPSKFARSSLWVNHTDPFPRSTVMVGRPTRPLADASSRRVYLGVLLPLISPHLQGGGEGGGLALPPSLRARAIQATAVCVSSVSVGALDQLPKPVGPLGDSVAGVPHLQPDQGLGIRERQVANQEGREEIAVVVAVLA